MKICIKKFLLAQYSIFRYAWIVKKYPGKSELKFNVRIYFELLGWYFKYGERNKNYAAWNLHQKGAVTEDYIGRHELLAIKTKAEKKLKKTNGLDSLNYDILTKDKYVAGSFLLANDIPCVPNEGLSVRGDYYYRNGQPGDLESLLHENGKLIFKSVAKEAGEGSLYVRSCEIGFLVNGKQMIMKEFMALLRHGVFVIQKIVQNHHRIQAINDSALNTTRIVTILDKDVPRYLTGFQAFATGGAKTDSWDKGSIYVGIDIENECLKDLGYLNLKGLPESVSSYHPDTQVAFKGYHIPHLKEAVDLCVKAHKLFYNNFIIGWDVAITENGPLIVEANEKPGMNAVQCVDGGLRRQILACHKELMKGNEDE